MRAADPLTRPVPDRDPQPAIPLVPEGPQPTPHRWLIQLLRRHWPIIGSVLVYAVGAGILTLVTPVAVQALVSNVAFATVLQPVLVLSLLVLGGLAFRGVLKVMQAWVVEALQRRLFVDFVELFATRFPRVSPALLRLRHGPELANRFFDVTTLQKTTASLLIGGLDAVLAVVVGMCVLGFYHPLLLAFDMLLVLSLTGWIWLLGRGGVRTAVEESRAKYAMADALEQTLGHPITARSEAGRETVVARIDQRAGEYLEARADHFQVVLRQLIGAVVLQTVASVGLLSIGGWLVISRQLTLGQLVAAELIVTTVVAAFASLGKQAESFYDLLAALDKLGMISTLDIEDPSGEKPRAAYRAAACELLPVVPGEDIHAGPAIQVPPGARVRVVGAGDAERETLFRSLYGLEANESWRVRIDGLDGRDLALDALRERVALVAGPEVWSGTLLENLKHEAADVDLFAVRKALDDLALGEELSRMPLALATPVNPSGASLSFGQALRVTLARAYLRRPQVLMVGNAIDALDLKTRRTVMESIARTDQPWTLFVACNDDSLRGLFTHELDVGERTFEALR